MCPFVYIFRCLLYANYIQKLESIPYPILGIFLLFVVAKLTWSKILNHILCYTQYTNLIPLHITIISSPYIQIFVEQNRAYMYYSHSISYHISMIFAIHCSQPHLTTLGIITEYYSWIEKNMLLIILFWTCWHEEIWFFFLLFGIVNLCVYVLLPALNDLLLDILVCFYGICNFILFYFFMFDLSKYFVFCSSSVQFNLGFCYYGICSKIFSCYCLMIVFYCKMYFFFLS